MRSLKEFNSRKIGIGPMSTEAIEAVYKYSSINNKELMLIASKNQIDHSGGYVNNWNTKEYSNFLKKLKNKYPNTNVKVCRDHCGPGFNGNYLLKDVYKTIDSDIENNFDLIHVDFSKAKKNYKKILELSKNAIIYMKKINPKIEIEIGTDENFAQKLSSINIKEFLDEMDFFLDFMDPEYFVVPTGSLVMEDKQFGFFNHKFIKSVHQRIKNRPILLKEHNADYLNSESINLRKEFISALNIAPQFGVFQTKFILDECVKFGIDTTDFLNASYKSKKWEKWLFTTNEKDVYKCSILAGHYNFQDKTYKVILEKLNKIDNNFNSKIINSHYEIIDHYVKNFY